MSLAANLPRTAPEPSPALRRRAAFTVVTGEEAATPRAPFAFAVVALLVSGLIGLLVLNTVLGKDAFKLHALQVEGRQLADREQVLTREVESLRAPSALAEKAAAMGMVQAGPPAFLRLPDGTVLGAPVPAQAPLPPEGEAGAPLADPDAPAASADETTADETATDETSDENEEGTADE